MAGEQRGNIKMAEGDDEQKANGNMPRAFISYASQDAAVANSVVENLEQHGLKCWLAPRDVRPGAQYADAIVEAINEAGSVVLLLSQSAVSSPHVGREVERAASKHKPIIALRIDAAALNRALEYFLSGSQWIDVPAIGMPVALAQLTEAVGRGSVQAATADHVEPAKPHARTGGSAKLITGGVLVIAVGLAAVLGLRFWSPSRNAAPPAAAVAITDKSIAVLPFLDLSEKHDQEYFSDGMAEEILDLLARLPGLKVIGRTSSFQFRGKTDDLRAIGSALGAAYVVEGSVRRSGEHVRVTAQLIDTRDGSRRWTETYDREVGDVLKVQDEIASGLVRALQLEIADTVRLRVNASAHTAEVYDLYLRGLHEMDQRNQAGWEAAIVDFRRVLELDPNFTPAGERLADSFAKLADYNFVTPQVGFEQARIAANTVLKEDPNSARAHAVLANVYGQYDFNWDAAAREFEAARNLAPTDPIVLRAGATERIAVGRWDEALALADTATSADPLAAAVFHTLGHAYLRLGRAREAEVSYRRALSIAPQGAWTHYYLGVALLLEGRAPEALTEMQQELYGGAKLAGLVVVYHALHRTPEAEAALAGLESQYANDTAMSVAKCYAYIGQMDKAFHWLNRAYVQKDPDLLLMKGDPLLVSLVGDPRFKAFLRKMNLPE